MLALQALSTVAAELGDITFKREGSGTEDVAPAVFPHWVHRMQFTCYVCHDAIFKMKAGANPITMADISAGKWCGTCHDGKTAFAAASFSTCTRCHRE
jgi:c(7)-type cytochrome triheme protein